MDCENALKAFVDNTDDGIIGGEGVCGGGGGGVEVHGEGYLHPFKSVLMVLEARRGCRK